MADRCCSATGKELELLGKQADQRRVLVIVLLINAVMFVAEFGPGVIAGSAALMADASERRDVERQGACRRSPLRPRWRPRGRTS